MSESEPGVYYVVSRCVRRAWLCGKDAYTRRNYDHRRGWVAERVAHFLEAFSVEVLAHALMANHCHLVGI